MNKPSVIFVGFIAIVLAGAIAWTLHNRAPVSADPQAAKPTKKAGDVTKPEDTSNLPTQRIPTQRTEPYIPPPSAATGVSKPPNSASPRTN